MSDSPKLSISHVGICTSNLERSVRFYTEALGFVPEYYVDVGPPFDLLTELPQALLHWATLPRRVQGRQAWRRSR